MQFEGGRRSRLGKGGGIVVMAPGSTQSLSDDRGGAHIACSRSARSSTTGRRSIHNLQTADHQAVEYDPSVVTAKREFKSHYDCSSD